MSKLQEYFNLANSDNIIFLDTKEKIFFIIYNDQILDESGNIHYGYRELNDILNSKTRNSIKICSARQFEQRIETKRYIYCGQDYAILIRIVCDPNLDECIFEIGKNWKELVEAYRGTKENGTDEQSSNDIKIE